MSAYWQGASHWSHFPRSLCSLLSLRSLWSSYLWFMYYLSSISFLRYLFFSYFSLATSDPYFLVYWADGNKKVVGKTATTTVIKKTLNPKWGKQNFTLYVQLVFFFGMWWCFFFFNFSSDCPADAKYLVFHAYDKDDIGKDDEMGALYFEISMLPLDFKFSRWFSLPCNNQKSAEVKVFSSFVFLLLMLVFFFFFPSCLLKKERLLIDVDWTCVSR